MAFAVDWALKNNYLSIHVADSSEREDHEHSVLCSLRGAAERSRYKELASVCLYCIVLYCIVLY